MKKAYIAVLILLTLLLGVSALTAQDAEAESPLLTFLSHVPISSTQGQPVTLMYIDYRALEASRGLETPSLEDYLSDRVWMASTYGIHSGLPLNYIGGILDELPATVGFNFFDVDRSASFGQPPTQAYLLQGDLNYDSMSAAFSNIGYEAAELMGMPALCSVDGCDTGQNVDIANRLMANPFGGHLGRREPLVFLPEIVANSPSSGVLNQVVQAASGEADSLADNPNYMALEEALSNYNLIQLMTLNSLELMFSASNMMDPLVRPSTDITSAEALAEALDQNGQPGTLAPYSLAALASSYEGDDELSHVILVYSDEAAAEQAAETLQTRLLAYESIVTGQAFADVIEMLDATVDEAQVYASSDNDRFVVIWTLRNPIPSNEENEDGQITASGLGFSRLVNMLYMQDVGFFAVSAE